MPSWDCSFAIRSSIAARAAAESAGGDDAVAGGPGAAGVEAAGGVPDGGGIAAELEAGCARPIAGASNSVKTTVHKIDGENISTFDWLTSVAM
jgi:hypothetical protein